MSLIEKKETQGNCQQSITQSIPSREELCVLLEQEQKMRMEAEGADKRLSELLMQAPIFIAIMHGPDHVFELINPLAALFFGRRSSDLIGKPIREALPQLEELGWFELMDRVYATGEIMSHNEMKAMIDRFNAGKLEEVHFNIVFQCTRDTQGNIDGVIVRGFDITDLVRARQEAQAARAEAEIARQRLYDLFMQAPAIISILHGPEHVYELVNPLTFQLLGKRDMVGKPVREAIPEVKGQGWYELLDQVYTTGETVRVNERKGVFSRHNDGRLEEAYFNFVFQPTRNAQGEVDGVMQHGFEVTELVQARQAAQESKQRLALAQQAGNIGTFEWEIQLDSVIWTTQLEALYGAPGPFKGTFDDWIHRVYPEDQQLVKERVYEALLGKAPFAEEFRVLWPDGSIHWLFGKAEIFYDDHDKPLRLIGMNIDITERKELERRKDDFIVMASHELRTPVATVKGYTQFLRARLKQGADPAILEILGIMDQQLHRLTGLIGDMLDITKIEIGRLIYREEEIDLTALVQEIIDHVRATAPDQSLTLAGEGQLRVFGDRDRLGQVVINLLSNAIKFSPLGSPVTVIVRKISENVQVSVQDVGIGIAKEHQEHIFERFYRVTDKAGATYPGMGIGLFLSHEIIARHHGEIWVESEKDQGAIFHFTLPLAKER